MCRSWLSFGRFHTAPYCTHRDAKVRITKTSCECATYSTSLPLVSGNTYLTSLPLVSGNTYLTSLPLVSVCRCGRHNSMKAEKTFISSTDPFSLILHEENEACTRGEIVSRLSLSYTSLHGDERWPMELSSNTYFRWPMEVTSNTYFCGVCHLSGGTRVLVM